MTKTLTIAELKDHCRNLRLSCRVTKLGSFSHEFRINLRPDDGGTEATAYYTEDRHDAFATASDLAARRDAQPICDLQNPSDGLYCQKRLHHDGKCAFKHGVIEVEWDTPTEVAFNTERLYTAEGQRIAATLTPEGDLLFIDIDRGIDAGIPAAKLPAGFRLTRDGVMRAYDYQAADWNCGMPFRHDALMTRIRHAARNVAGCWHKGPMTLRVHLSEGNTFSLVHVEKWRWMRADVIEVKTYGNTPAQTRAVRTVTEERESQ